MSLTANRSVRRREERQRQMEGMSSKKKKTKSQRLANLVSGGRRTAVLSRHMEAFAWVLGSVSAVKGRGGKQRGQNGRARVQANVKRYYHPVSKPQIANLGGVTPATSKPRPGPNHPVMLLLTANEGGDVKVMNEAGGYNLIRWRQN